MAAYIDHAAYQVRDPDWCRRFFHEVSGMEEEKSRTNADGLTQVWFYGGIQLCESRETAVCGQAPHLSLIVNDPETVRSRALEWGCKADSRPGCWLRAPIPLFPVCPVWTVRMSSSSTTTTSRRRTTSASTSSSSPPSSRPPRPLTFPDRPDRPRTDGLSMPRQPHSGCRGFLSGRPLPTRPQARSQFPRNPSHSPQRPAAGHQHKKADGTSKDSIRWVG